MLRDFFTKNVGWKIFSVVLAIIIWVTVKTVSNDTLSPGNPLAVTETRSFTNLPVLVVSAAADVRDFKVVPSSADITLSAKPEIMINLSEKDIHVVVDLTDITSTTGLRKHVEVSTPPGVTVNSIDPTDVDIVVPLKRSAK